MNYNHPKTINYAKPTEDIIFTNLFEFMKYYFDFFGHHKHSNSWWLANSWSPFVEACFYIWGKEINCNVGMSYTFPNFPIFLEIINYIDDANKFQKPIDEGYDLSWRDENKNCILKLEHEETGDTPDKQLKEIRDEIIKLNNSPGLFNILVSRPHLRRFRGFKDTYPNAIKYYKEKIENMFKDLNIASNNKNWIVILIGPNNIHLRSPGDKTEILFYRYIWNGNGLSGLNIKSFEVELDQNRNDVKISNPQTILNKK